MMGNHVIIPFPQKILMTKMSKKSHESLKKYGNIGETKQS